MKVTSVVAFAALGSAFVLPDEQVSHLRHIETNQRQPQRAVQDFYNQIPSSDELASELEAAIDQASGRVESTYEKVSDFLGKKLDHYATESKNALDSALSVAEDAGSEAVHRAQEAYFDATAWVDSVKEQVDEEIDYSTLGHHHHHPHHGPHVSNKTVYQLIAESKYTTKLAKLINKYDDLVEALNGTSANFTVFAPTDRAFEKIPEHAHKPSKEFIKALLTYHVSPDYYPAARILVTRTVPTLLKSPALGKKPLPQRLSTNIGFRGLTVNYYSRVVAVNIRGKNGVIHGIDSILVPPPRVLKLIDLLPSEFSTLELGLVKTGLYDQLNTTDHNGGTFFAPSNWAFKKLGPRINAFLFSEYGRKYLKALLEYHVVPDETLYSDAFYKADSEDKDLAEHVREGIPKGVFHVDLPTLLKDRHLGVDIARYGRLIEIKINAFARVSTSDLVGYDGVLHTVNDVLIPPKKLGNGELESWDGSRELTEEDLKERLAPFVKSAISWTDL